MALKFKLIGFGLFMALQLAVNSHVSAINVKNLTTSPLVVIVYLHGGAVVKENMFPETVLDVNGDIRKLEIFKATPSGIPLSEKPFICEEIFGSVIEIVEKNKHTLKCQ